MEVPLVIPEDIDVILDLLNGELFDADEFADLYFYYQHFQCMYTPNGVCLNQLGRCEGCHLNFTLESN